MNPLTQFARDYPIMAAVLVVVIMAGVITMALDWYHQTRSHP